MSRRLLFALVTLLSACGAKSVPFTAQLVTQSCVDPSPMEGVTHFQFRITGEGMTPIITVTPVNAHAQSLADIPVGTHRVLEVRGYAGDPTNGGTVISVGRSLPFDVPTAPPADGKAGVLHVALRRVNVFEPPNLLSAPNQCTQMTSARAGHSATLLSDGRVFIAGGYRRDGSGASQTLSTAEIYDPSTGAFTATTDIGVTDSQQLFTPSPRAFHTATRLPGDQVLLAGGEVEGAPATVLGSALVFDPLTHVYGALSLSTPRTHATAAADNQGRVLIAGGIDGSGAAVATPEWYDPSTGTSHPIPFDLPRIGAVAAPVGDGSALAVIGGTDGTQLALDVRFFGFDGAALSPLGAPVTLREGRRSAAVAPFLDQGAALVIGGFADADPAQITSSVGSSELIQGGDSPSETTGPAIGARGDLCAAALADGQVLAAGGRVAGFDTPTIATDQAELITHTPNGDATSLGMPPLPEPRWQHACTPLGDGSVLILGGVDDTAGSPLVLQDAVIFMPAPLD